MKKRKKALPQLNKSSVWKMFIFVAIIVLVEVAAGLFIFSQFSSRTYRQEYAAIQQKADVVSKKVYQSHTENIGDIESDGELLSAILEECVATGEFDYYIIFNETHGGNIVSGGGLNLSGNIRDNYGLSYNSVGKIELDGNTYIFAPSALGESNYRIGGLKDFTERQKIISNLRGNTVAILIAAGMVITAAFIIYAYLLANKERTHHFKYRVRLDKEGRIIKSNAAFKHEFAAVSKIDTANLDKDNFNLVSMCGNVGERLVAMRLSPSVAHPLVLAGEVANADSFIQSGGSEDSGELDADGKATSSLSKVFEGFTTKGKRTLLGVLYISNLDRIKTLFGKQMAIDIQHIIVKKVREKFTYAYELDFAYIGVTYPDGKKLDNLMSDMEDIHRYINAPIKMEDNLFTLDVKAGFAMCDASMSPLNFEHAYKAAEAARQRVMDTNIADYIVYHESQRKLYDKYFITYDIKQMLSEGAFEMEYQPQYNIKEERIEGFEALFRVKKSWNVNVDTFSFITYAERTGAMVQLGDFIFDTGMQFAKKLEGKNVSVSLNVSPVQLMQAGFTENFLRLYKKYDLKPRSICVEITESFLMTNFTETLKKLDILTAQGIDVHLDDFGTEYSSLLYIKKLPISTIKIDKEFVKDVLTSKESQAIIKFITNIAKLLNRTTICEGVETTQEFDMLNYLGCDTIQGWIIGKSMKPEAALEIVDTFDYKRIAAAKNGGK
ncbi:MAG: EAL domain-containing protein [Clostridia bacterium]|nr:EAL domain-containing protein [Clostridia bacterium]